MRGPSAGLLERLADLALVELDVLLGAAPPDAARALVAAYVADLENALGEARILLRDSHRDLGAGPDPLAILDLPAERRAGAGAAASSEVSAKLAGRAAARRELARLEETVRAVLPRLLEADRRFAAL